MFLALHLHIDMIICHIFLPPSPMKTKLLLPKIKMNRKLITKYCAGPFVNGRISCERFLCKNNSSRNKLYNAQWFWQIYIRFIHDDISTINVCGGKIFYDCFRFGRRGKSSCMFENLHMIGFPCDISEYWFCWRATRKKP